MRKLMCVLLLITACSDSEPAATCQEAFAHYYSIGCTFVDLETGQPVPQGQITSDCQSLAAAAPSQCQGELDSWLNCLNEVQACATAVCSQEQMALLRCN